MSRPAHRTIAAPESPAIVVAIGSARDVASGAANPDGFSQSTTPIGQSTHAPDASIHRTEDLDAAEQRGSSSPQVPTAFQRLPDTLSRQDQGDRTMR